MGCAGGTVEADTDHARAGNTGAPRHDLVCKPWCLFNLTADIGMCLDYVSNIPIIAHPLPSRLCKYLGVLLEKLSLPTTELVYVRRQANVMIWARIRLTKESQKQLQHG